MGSGGTVTEIGFFREGGRRTATATSFCPRRATKGREERQRQLQLLLSTKGREGPRRTTKNGNCYTFLSAKGREERQRQLLFVHEGPRRKSLTPFLIGEGGGRWASCLGCTCEVLSFDIRVGYLYRLGGVPARCGRAEATCFGAIAQLGERYNGIVEVKGSSPFSSTKRDGRMVCVPVFVSWIPRFDL